MKIKQKVSRLIKRYHTNDPFMIAKELNISVLRESLGSIRGYYQYFRRNRIIHINEGLCDEEQRIVCAHELGHAVLHPKINTVFIQNYTFYIGDRFEREANQFAAELLLPDDLLERYPSYSIEEIASIEEVHVNLISYKFNINL